jgi:hypothetical protein
MSLQSVERDAKRLKIDHNNVDDSISIARPEVSIYHFPFVKREECEFCSDKESLLECAEKTRDKFWGNWIHINGLTLCKNCFSNTQSTRNNVKIQRDIYLIK